MFETTIEKDLQLVKSCEEYEAISSKIYRKYRNEFLTFIEELKRRAIAQDLYNSLTPEETISTWEKYSYENQELFAQIKSWAEGREEYFNTYEPIPIFEEDEEIDCILEIALIIFIVKDEYIFSEEDINEEFFEKITEILKESPNRLLKAAGWYIECDGWDSMTRDNIYTYLPNED